MIIKITINKIKIVVLTAVIILIALFLLSPYFLRFYLKSQYTKLAINIEKLIPDIKITGHFEHKYFKSLLITKVYKTSNVNLENKNNHIITLQHEVTYVPYRKLMATIKSTIIDSNLEGLLQFLQALQQEKNNQFQLITNIDFYGNMHSSLKNLNINYNFNNNNKLFVDLSKITLTNNSYDDLNFSINIPKLLYHEAENNLEVNNLYLYFNVTNFKNLTNRKISLSSKLENLYVFTKSKPIFRLINFSVQQEIGNALIGNINFLKLNIMDHKFGPLATKLQLNNLYLSQIINVLSNLRLPIIGKNTNKHNNFIEITNSLLKNKPNLSIDLLLQIGNDKLKILSDTIVSGDHLDWFTVQDLLDSLNINLTAKIPKTLLVDLVTFLVENQQKRNKKVQHLIDIDDNNKNTKEPLEELEDLVFSKIAYLIKNNIIIEQEDGFYLDLFITENSFYSKNNPFKIFTF